MRKVYNRCGRDVAMKIAVDQWYNCQYPDQPNLCKVTRRFIDVPDRGQRVLAYAVVCYYTCEDVYIGSMAECKQWIEIHLIGGV